MVNGYKYYFTQSCQQDSFLNHWPVFVHYLVKDTFNIPETIYDCDLTTICINQSGKFCLTVLENVIEKYVVCL